MELSFDDVQKRILPESIKTDKPDKADTPETGIIGQDRAVRALEFGLHMEASGFNIYVSGSPGMGKMTSVRSFLRKIAHEKLTPPDICCMYNFADPYEPVVIQLPAGKGSRLAADMEHLVLHIREDLPGAFESEEYGSLREETMKELVKSRDRLSTDIGEKAKERGFSLQLTPMGLLLIPVRDGEPISDESLAGLPEELRKELEGKREILQKEIKSGQASIRRVENETRERVQDLDRQIVLNALGTILDEIRQHYLEFPSVTAYLDSLREDVLRNTDLFKIRQGEPAAPAVPGMDQLPNQFEHALSRYRVNVMVDNSTLEGAPVIVELNPTCTNLLGRLEKEMKLGALLADFSLIRAGALAQANGGYLVLPVEDLLRNPWSWDSLKRSLRSSQLRIEEVGEQFGFLTLKTLRPQPIPLSVKVILVGSPEIHQLLYSLDSEFAELFKVKADFDTRMPVSETNIATFLSFASSLCAREKLRPLDRSAQEAILRHAAKYAEHQERISVNFGNISDVIREANYWAGKGGSESITEGYIRQALEERVYRSSLLRDRIRELMEEGVLVIATEGKKVGQVNGLSIGGSGEFSFGRPSRITAVAGPGREGIIDIERETKLGGPIHTKGVLILTGCLIKKYPTGKPASLSAQLVFEQNYSGIEGDSASQAEFYALVSALSGVPLRQDIAVTGSMDQFGDAQAIGGVNEKIEGFFDICNAAGLTGNQGVIIPDSNRKNLMLRYDVAEAIRQGRFHVWAVNNVDEGLEILTGEEAGRKRDDGTYPMGTVNRKAGDTLKGWAEISGEAWGTGRKKPES